jgi:hypothetical protein
LAHRPLARFAASHRARRHSARHSRP